MILIGRDTQWVCLFERGIPTNPEQFGETSTTLRLPTTISKKGPNKGKRQLSELPKKGRLQQSMAKMTRAICMLAVKGPSYIWRWPNE